MHTLFLLIALQSVITSECTGVLIRPGIYKAWSMVSLVENFMSVHCTLVGAAEGAGRKRVLLFPFFEQH
jgi:hypothetical protein